MRIELISLSIILETTIKDLMGILGKLNFKVEMLKLLLRELKKK